MPVGTPRFFPPFFGEKRSKISPVRSRVRSGLFLGKFRENFGRFLAKILGTVSGVSGVSGVSALLQTLGVGVGPLYVGDSAGRGKQRHRVHFDIGECFDECALALGVLVALDRNEA